MHNGRIEVVGSPAESKAQVLAPGDARRCLRALYRRRDPTRRRICTSAARAAEHPRASLKRLRCPQSLFAELVTRVDISREGMQLSLELPIATSQSDEKSRDPISLSRVFPLEMKRRGIEMRMVLEGDCKPSRFDRPLIKAVARARRWSNQVLSGQVPSIRAIARQERIAPRYVRDLLPLAFLSPRIIEAILEGRQPPDLTVVGLTRRIDLPLLWSVQERALGLRDSTRLVL